LKIVLDGSFFWKYLPDIEIDIDGENK